LQAQNLVEKEKQRSAALEYEVCILKQAKEEGISAKSRTASLEHHSQDMQSKLHQAQAERDLNQAELLEARKVLQKLACSLDEERHLNASLCDQSKALKADLSVCSILFFPQCDHVQCSVQQLSRHSAGMIKQFEFCHLWLLSDMNS
jgi:hypothetical protein